MKLGSITFGSPPVVGALAAREPSTGAALSPDEVKIAASDERLREQLADQLYEAKTMRGNLEREIRAALPADFPFEKIAEFADWQARELNMRDRMDRMGFTQAHPDRVCPSCGVKHWERSSYCAACRDLR